MHVLLVGGGGREHALSWRLAQSPEVTRLSVTANNPGFPCDARRLSSAGMDLVGEALRAGVDLVVVGPEQPICAGMADAFNRVGIPVCGPPAAAARLEGSKSFAKRFMNRHGIPTARWSVHEDQADAHAAVRGPCVVKADGLAGGKGVTVAVEPEGAHAAIDALFSGRFGQAGSRVVIEELLEGREVSVIALCDGERAVPLLPARDHKRRFARDQGPNTGGMGAVCPVPDLEPRVVEEIREKVLDRVVEGMAAEGTPYRGVLYAGLMLTANGPKVLEFNVRFGDPECQPLMMMLDEDLLPWLYGAAVGHLPSGYPRWRAGAACCVVMVAGGYPGPVVRGAEITGVPEPSGDLIAFYAGARREASGRIITDGGRVLGVTAYGDDLSAARARAYRAVGEIHFDTADWRPDIGGRPIRWA